MIDSLPTRYSALVESGLNCYRAALSASAMGIGITTPNWVEPDKVSFAGSVMYYTLGCELDWGVTAYNQGYHPDTVMKLKALYYVGNGRIADGYALIKDIVAPRGGFVALTACPSTLLKNITMPSYEHDCGEFFDCIREVMYDLRLIGL